MAILTLKEVIDIIRSGEWIESLRVITADLNKNTGGKVLTFKKCRIARRKSLEQSGLTTKGFSDVTRNPEHNLNFTMNLELENGQIRKIHPILIFEINNQRVA